MENQYTAESLKEAIKALEIKQAEERQLLLDQLFITYESLKPVNILKKMVKDFSVAENLKQDFYNAIAGMISGLVTKKLIVGKTKNPVLKFVGLAVQFGITTFVSKYYSSIQDSIVQFFSRFLEEKKEE